MPVSLTTLGLAYSQNFDTLTNFGTSGTLPTGWVIVESGGGGNDNEQYTADNGSNIAGDTYSYGAAGSTERALGSIRSGSLQSEFGVSFTNDTGSTVTSLTIGYTGEQWRLGTTGRGVDQLDFQYSLNATDLTTGTWADVNPLDFSSPVTAGTVGALDGNSSANQKAVSFTITGLSIAPGATFFLRWVDADAGSNDDGLAIDNFTLTPQSVVGAPTFTGLDDNPTFTENAGAVLLDGDAHIVSSTYDGATLTLQRSGGADPNDVFGTSFASTVTLSDGQVLIREDDPNDNPDLGQIDIAIGSYVQNAGTLSIVFNANATAGRVDAALQALQYAYAGENPPASATIAYAFNGDAATGSITVNIIAANDAPSIDSLNGAAVYRPGSGGVVLSPDIAISDPDSVTLDHASVTLQFGSSTNDVLSAVGTSNIAVTYTSGTLTLNGVASLAEYQQVLATVRYSYNGADPTEGQTLPDRSLVWTLNDGAPLNADSAQQGSTIAFAPGVDLDLSAAGTGYSTFFAQGGAAVAIADTDVDVLGAGTQITAAHITLTNAHAGDVLSANGVSGLFTVSVVEAAGQILLTLTNNGGATAADFETALRQVQFANAGQNINQDARVVTVDLTDANSSVSNLAVATIAIGATHGTSGDDSYAAPDGSSVFEGNGGVDTISFNFRLVDATVTYSGNQVIIDGPSSHTVLSGFETYVFTDGTVNNKDSDALVDDLFYYSKYHDVWTAHLDADSNFHNVGWKAGRDPDAFFSTSTYLSANPDVKAAGIDPLLHFDQAGWKEGRVPSIKFDPAAYLAANPDVAAAGVDPLAHFLQSGYQEGRQPIAPTSLIASNGFDYVYYLQNNPDVAAAGVDPLQHFQTVGWKEGRNPNALFDVSGYLNTYTDVKAAGVNPLDHYNQSGWHEGRDPSVNFDTTSYLSAYPDIQAAHVNPLIHFLQFGQHEGRSAFADSVWG